jgi:hypothetical protein
MSMRWIKTSGMKLKPYNCAACGSTPQKEDGSGPEDAVFREGVDINWGDSLYLCKTCVRIVGELMGMAEPHEVSELKRKLKDSEDENESLTEDLNTLQSRVDRMLDGARAKKEVAKQRPRKKVNG